MDTLLPRDTRDIVYDIKMNVPTSLSLLRLPVASLRSTENFEMPAGVFGKTERAFGKTECAFGKTVCAFGKIADIHLEETNAIRLLTNYVNTLEMDKSRSSSIFEKDLPYRCEGALFTLKYSFPYWDIAKTYPGYYVKAIHRMTNVWVPSGENLPSTNGWFARVQLPWARVIQCIIAIRGDNTTQIVFPTENKTYTLETGSYIAFDSNRDIPYFPTSLSLLRLPVASLRSTENFDIFVRLHYIVYPEKWSSWIVDLYISIYLGVYWALRRY